MRIDIALDDGVSIKIIGDVLDKDGLRIFRSDSRRSGRVGVVLEYPPNPSCWCASHDAPTQKQPDKK